MANRKLFRKHFKEQINSRATPAPCVHVQAHTQILHTHQVRQNENLPYIYTVVLQLHSSGCLVKCESKIYLDFTDVKMQKRKKS